MSTGMSFRVDREKNNTPLVIPAFSMFYFELLLFSYLNILLGPTNIISKTIYKLHLQRWRELIIPLWCIGFPAEAGAKVALIMYLY